MEISFDEQYKFLMSVRTAIREEAAEQKNSAKTDKYGSDDQGILSLSLSNAQGSYPKIFYNRTAAYLQNEYSDLNMILAAVLPILKENELSLTQWTELQEGNITVLHTKITHSSGQWIESRARVIPPKNDPLSFTSTVNQIKRQQLMSLLALSVVDDPYDDNAEIQLADDRQILAKGTQVNINYNPRERGVECISRDQLTMLEKELQTCPDFIEEIFKGAHIESLADLPRRKFEFTMEKIAKVNNLRAGRLPSAK
jgi:hypothetical protein